MRRYYSNYLQLYKDAVGEKLGKDGVIKNFLIDSYEAGKGTWTPRMEEEFEKRRGYSLRPWMPVLTGQIIGSAQRSEQFLFDWRQTLGELIVENHYDLVNEVLAEYGMKRFSEAHEERRAFVGDGMSTKKGADMPMAAFWVRAHAGWYDNFTGCESDLKEASSVAHVYGQNICGAESFTTNGRRGKWDGYWAYQCHPGFLKRYADASMAMGLNRFVIHSSVHQPSDDHVPGLSLGIYGQWFNRHDTWAEEAKVWLDYLAINSYMLSQGRYVADIAYLYGEDTNPSARFYTTENEAPSGYNYDYVNAEILQDVLKVKGGKLLAESGAEYSVVMIDTAIHKMSIGLVRTLDRISSKGVMICGNRPQRCASLGYDAEFESLCDKIWSRSNVRRPQDLILSLKDAGKSEDAILGRDSLSFVHRKMKWGEIYWVANISSQPCEVEVSLNVEGYEPEIWNATDCSREKVSYSIEGGRTKILLNMERDDAQFIVLAKKTKCKSANYNKLEQTTLKEISGEWALSFPSERGAPKHIYCDSLINLSQSEQEEVKYYSGSIIYSKEFSIDSLPETAVIDLGRVHNMARVYLNGQDLGLAWKEPYRLNCSKSLKLGVNTLEIKVINSWANRLIGDARSPVNATKYSFTSETYYATEDPLPASGLLGPVRLIEIKEHK